ncbi:hypothetical protein RRG08_026487 [Elysia crispata]|uniref:Uncharacterized protein n=1 Tax=Elysia crispata TaxID=231223 RepID=A0AAE1CS87_9GAST|nr:hypothetical protein RRG08_026487 [Elysia crispata]
MCSWGGIRCYPDIHAILIVLTGMDSKVPKWRRYSSITHSSMAGRGVDKLDTLVLFACKCINVIRKIGKILVLSVRSIPARGQVRPQFSHQTHDGRGDGVIPGGATTHREPITECGLDFRFFVSAIAWGAPEVKGSGTLPAFSPPYFSHPLFSRQALSLNQGSKGCAAETYSTFLATCSIA